MDTKIFGAFIAECRKEKNMTLADRAVKLNVTDNAVSRWERYAIHVCEELAAQYKNKWNRDTTSQQFS